MNHHAIFIKFLAPIFPIQYGTTLPWWIGFSLMMPSPLTDFEIIFSQSLIECTLNSIVDLTCNASPYFNLKCNLWTNPLSLESLQRSLLIHFETFSILCHTVTPFSQYIQFKFRQVVNFLQQFEKGTLIIIILYLMVYL